MIGDRQILTDIIFHQPHAGQAVIDLFCHMVWGVGLIPQGRRALADWQYRRPVGVSGHHARGAADQRTGDLQTTDGHRHVFRQAVAVDQLDIVAVPDANGWPHIATVNPPHRGAGTGRKRPVRAL